MTISGFREAEGRFLRRNPDINKSLTAAQRRAEAGRRLRVTAGAPNAGLRPGMPRTTSKKRRQERRNSVQVQQPRPVESLIDPNTGMQAFATPASEFGPQQVGEGGVFSSVAGWAARQAFRNPVLRRFTGRMLGRSITAPAALPGPVRVGGQIATIAGTGLAVDQGINWAGPIISGAGSLVSNLPDINVRLPNINLSNPFGGGDSDMMQFPGVGGMMPASGTIVKAWDTAPGPGITGGGAFPVFALLVDGRIAVFSLDGSVKTYRPKKHIVIPTNPRLSQIRKLDRTYKRVQKSLRRVVPAPRRRS